MKSDSYRAECEQSVWEMLGCNQKQCDISVAILRTVTNLSDLLFVSLASNLSERP